MSDGWIIPLSRWHQKREGRIGYRITKKNVWMLYWSVWRPALYRMERNDRS